MLQSPAYTPDELSIAFLRKILPAAGPFVMQYKKRHGGWSAPIFAMTVEELWEQIKYHDRNNCDTYHACVSFKEALTNPPKEQPSEYTAFFPKENISTLRIYGRTKANVRSVKSFWRDIDIGPNKHYKTQGEALQAVGDFCKKYKLPPPLVVISGNGLHIYWVLDKEIDPITWKRYNDGLIRLCEKEDLHCERVDITSVLRTPGTSNYKNKQKPLPVEIDPQFLDHPPCTLEQLDAFAKASGHDKPTTTEVTQLKLLPGASVPDAPGGNYPPSYATEIVKRCGQLRHMRDKKGNIPELVWYADLGVLAYCIDGEERAPEWSAGHPDFTKEETLQKMEQWRNAADGPTTCAKLNTDNPGICERCPYWKRIKSPIVLGAIPDDIAELNKQFFMLRNMGGKCLIGEMVPNPLGTGEMLVLQRPADFKVFFSNRGYSINKKKKLGHAWVEHLLRRQYESVDLVPGAPGEMPNGNFNLWRGFGVKAKQGSWERMFQHILDVLACGNEEAAAYILKWTAWSFQHPDELAEAAPVLRGQKGTGKGVFGHAIRQIFGEHGLHISNQEHLTGKHNAHLRSCLFMFADEAFWAGDKKGESVLKSLITERTILIEPKFVDATLWPNRMHLLMAANANWVVPASADERRFAVFDVSNRYARNAAPEKEREAYFNALYAELNNGGLGAMLYDLLHKDLGDWHPRRVPATEGLQKQKALSLPALAKWMELTLQDGKLPGEDWVCDKPRFVTTDHLMEDVRKRMSRHEVNYIGDEKLADYLRDEWKGRVTKRRTPNGGPRGWMFAPLADMRATWEQRYGTWLWDDPDLKEWG